ncbi:MAG: DegT/DnrJ/EryC1/StrS family aminotransferase [Desulfobacteraceae bacterium]|nr:DegT/DnrJ/EryC1/StrS family aminotransferase [Desulfobacteraceae bacterium]
MKLFRTDRPFPRIGRTLPPAAAPLSPGELLQGLRGVLRPRREMARFEAELKDFFQVRHCFPVSSGTTALYLLLRALQQLRPGRDEVIIPAYTCFSVPSALIRAGLKITLCDNDAGTLDFDFTRLEQLLERAAATGRLLCVLPTHLFGLPADVPRLRSLLVAKGLAEVPVIEDAAQAMGATDGEGRKLGTLGDAGVFSFGRGKAVALGEGGVIVTGRDDLARALRPLAAGLAPYSPFALLRLVTMTAALSLLIRPAWFWLPKALPWLKLGETIYDPEFAARRFSGFQAGLARSWPAKLKRLQAIRAEQAAALAAALPSGLRPCRPAGGGNPLRLPVRAKNLETRDAIVAGSDRRGLGIMPGYPATVAGIAALKNRVGGLPVPNAAALAEELLTLPVHGFVTAEDRRRTAVFLAGMRPSGQREALPLAGQEEA